MGRGNTCVYGEFEGLFYIDYDNFTAYILDEDENETEERDYDFERILFEEWECEFLTAVKKRFPSFSDVKTNRWINQEDRIVLENSLFYICITDNEWGCAIKLLQRESDTYTYHKNGGYYYISDNTAMQKRHYQNYLNGIENILFNFFPEIGLYSGAWMHRTKQRPENFKFTF